MKLVRSALVTAASVLLGGGMAIAHAQRSRASLPTQDAVASKNARFGVVASSSPEIKRALEAKNLAAGMKMAGKTGSFIGVVASVYLPRNHAAVYIDFSDPYKNSISGQVLAADFAKFPSLSALKGKKVLITGKFFLYAGTRPEVSIASPAGIKLVAERAQALAPVIAKS